MKQCLFLFTACLLLCPGAFARTLNHPFVVNGKVWTYYRGNSTGESTWEEVFSLEGDTAIGSRQCIKLYLTRNRLYDPLDHLYKGALYEDDGKVYYIEPGSTTPALLYDFSSEPETIVKVGPTELTIKERKLYKYRGEYWTEIGWQPVEPDYQDYYNYIWYEGIGMTGASTLLGIYEGYGPWYTGGFISLVNCKVNDQIIFDPNEFYKSAEIVTGIVLPSDEEIVNGKSSNGKWFDLHGRKLSGKPARGIYIEDGKKFVK